MSISSYTGSTCNSVSPEHENHRKTTPRKKDKHAKHDIKRLNPDSLAQWNQVLIASEKCENVRMKESIVRVKQFIEMNPIDEKKGLGTVPSTVFKTGETKVTFLKSIFQNRAPTAFF